MTERRSSGFTLVELLVVILIIGMLAAILIPVLMQAINVARQAKQEVAMSSLVDALTAYEQTTMKLPPGDGRGSREMVKALREPGPKKLPHLEFHDDLISP